MIQGSEMNKLYFQYSMSLLVTHMELVRVTPPICSVANKQHFQLLIINSKNRMLENSTTYVKDMMT